MREKLRIDLSKYPEYYSNGKWNKAHEHTHIHNKDIPTHPDPSKTNDIVRAYERDALNRWRLLDSIMEDALVNKGVLILSRFNQQIPIEIAGNNDEETLDAFIVFFVATMAEIMDEKNDRFDYWATTYANQAYTRGIFQTETELRGFGMAIPERSILAMQTDSFHRNAMQAIIDRQFELFKTVQEDMAADVAPRLKQALLDSYAQEKTVQQTYKALYNEINNRINKVAINRSKMIARTEIVRANTIARVNSYKERGVTEVNWILSDDPCPLCIAVWEGNPYSVDQVLDYMPQHPYEKCSIATTRTQAINPRL